MGRYVTGIKVNKLYHIENVEIGVVDDAHPHLILTGRNGSGKTVTVDAIAKYLDDLLFTTKGKQYTNYAKALAEAKNPQEKRKAEKNLEAWRTKWVANHSAVEVELSNREEITEKYDKGEFIIAYYGADRKVKMREGGVPSKPNIPQKTAVKNELVGEFLNFLAFQKIVASLAGNEGKHDDQKRIEEWFDGFEGLLRKIYGDDSLRLVFGYQPNFKFTINTRGKNFGFNAMADGYKALLEIVADLIMKMQQQGGGLTGAYKKEGIVVIDEVETHLHLEMQKTALPLLTTIFPNIQFIVTTHSPFVVSSLSTATAFDMERHVSVDDLTEYSYEALAEGYFGVDGTSGYITVQLEKMKSLLKKDDLEDNEKRKLKRIMESFDKVPEIVAPTIYGRYREMKSEYSERLRSLSLL